MKILALLVASGAFAQGLDVAEIMARVGANQTGADARRREYVYTQRQTLRLMRGNGKVAREEHREYLVLPRPKKTGKQLTHFDGRYEASGKYVSYDQPNYHYKGMDIDGDLINDLSDDLANNQGTRDGLAANLFPLTLRMQTHYRFHLKGTETYRGRQVLSLIHISPLR